MFKAYGRDGPPKTQAQILAELESGALLPADLQAMLDTARDHRVATEANLRGAVAPAVSAAPADEGTAT